MHVKRIINRAFLLLNMPAANFLVDCITVFLPTSCWLHIVVPCFSFGGMHSYGHQMVLRTVEAEMSIDGCLSISYKALIFSHVDAGS